MSYQDVKLNDLLGTLIDYRGKTPPKTDAGIPLITAKVIKGGRILDNDHEYIAEDYYDEWMRRGLPRQWDVLITTEAPLGEVAILKTTEKVALAQRVILLRGDSQKIDQRYLCFALQSPLVQARLNARATGATVAGIKQSELREVLLPLYPLATQRRIASILSAYDDLIENNTRRIAILEEMARRIYEEWFVRFRFPGYEQVKMVESELGLIPVGWIAAKLGEHLVSIESGKRPKGGISEIEDGVPSIGAENVISIGRHNFDSEKLISKEFFDSMKKGVVADRDVAVYKDGAYIGRSTYFRDSFPHRVCAVNEHVFLLRSSGIRLTQNQLYLWLQRTETVDTIRATNANAAQPGINQKSVSGLSLVLPDRSVAASFDKTVEPLLAGITNLAKRNRILRQTRDLLLPKLISGELDVSTLPEPEEAIAA